MTLLFLALLTTTCQKPDAPTGGNKIEIGQTTADSVSYFTAKVSTTVESTGGNQILQHGHCWSTKNKPTTADAKTTLGKLDKAETFSSELTGLENNTTYYIRSYITYTYGTVYGTEQNMQTLKTGMPLVDSALVSNVTISSAQFSAEILADSGLFVSSRGFCWDTDSVFTIDDCLDSTIVGDGLGIFNSEVSGLNEGVTYFVKAYAVNEKGTSYGDIEQFTTLPITVPEVNTTDITEITINSAKSGGNVTSNGNSTVTARGIVWGTNENPTVEDNDGKTSDGSGIGIFISSLTNLQDSSTYYVRAYASNEKGTAYGSQKSFQTTAIGAPTVTTTTITNITTSSAKGGGNITDAGNGTVTARGVCWNTTGGPTLENSIGYTTNGIGIGSFTSNITGLNDGVEYFVRAYATNEKGTNYGEAKQFSTIPITIPEVATEAVSEITIHSAKSGGNVTSAGNGTVTARGICWNTTGGPSLENSIGYTTNGTGTGSFASQITGLTENTTYYVAAYATNEKGSGYGEVKSFTTLELTLPVVETAEITNITANSATGGGNVTSNDNGTVIARGVCWNTTGNPTLENSTGQTTDGSGTGSFTSNITGLTENTTYYVAAYATNEEGTNYGDIKTFVTLDDPCGGVTTITYHGQTYHTVPIGDQCWMKESLNYQSGNSWCYDNDPANCDIYGRLYDWATVMNGTSSSNEVPSGVQGICPDGWHLPSDAEWTILVDYLGGSNVAGGKMKETGTTHWYSPNTGATNESGFTALPGGYRGSNGDFYNLHRYGYWWSATEYSSTSAWYRTLYYNNDDVGRTGSNKEFGFSVRCVKDY